MKSYLKRSMRRAVVALNDAVFLVIMFLFALGARLWAFEVQRLVGKAKRMGWTVRFVPSVNGDAIGEVAGMAIHRDKVILVRTVGMTQKKIAAVLRHELDHAGGVEYARVPNWLRCMGTWGTLAGLVSFAYETVAGATLGCTTVAPATYDEGGYGASSMVYTNIGEITDLGAGYGRTYNTVSHAPIASAMVTQKKGGYTLAPIDITLAWDQTDAGQDLLRTAANDNTILTFKLTKQGGDIRYFTAQVSKFIENFGTVDNVVIGMVTLLRQKDIVQNPA